MSANGMLLKIESIVENELKELQEENPVCICETIGPVVDGLIKCQGVYKCRYIRGRFDGYYDRRNNKIFRLTII